MEKKPTLTLPPAEAALLRNEYSKATSILEYGSGGSTVLASELSGKHIISVESDMNWLKSMQAWFDENPGQSAVHLHHGDIGPTREWGYPQTDRYWKNFINYSFGVWEDNPDFYPDVVFIDGRFRVASFIATMMNIKKKCIILFDDYVDRSFYHSVEKFVEIDFWAGRMARFEIEPFVKLDASFPEMVRLCQEAQ